MLVTLNKQNQNIDRKNKKQFTNQIKSIFNDNSNSVCLSQKLKHYYEDTQSTVQIDQKYINLKKNNMHSIKYTKKNDKQNIFEGIPNEFTVKGNILKNYLHKQSSNKPQNSSKKVQNSAFRALNHFHKDSMDKFGSNYSTQANSRQKSRATSLQSSICCTMLKCAKQSEQQWKQVPKRVKKQQKVMAGSPDITKVVRTIMLDWLFEISFQLLLPRQALYNSIDYVDKYVKLKTVTKKDYQQVGLTCLFLASKLETSRHPSIQSFLQQVNCKVTIANIVKIERDVINTLKFKLNPPTMYQYMTLLIFTMKSYKNLYKNIQWMTNLPTIEKGNQIYKKLFWIMDGVLMQGELISKFQKQDLCLAIMYISIIGYMENQHSKKGSLNLQENLQQFNTDVTSLVDSYQLFMSYTTTTTKTLSQLNVCIQQLNKWIHYTCICTYDNEYHTELKQIALIKQ